MKKAKKKGGPGFWTFVGLIGLVVAIWGVAAWATFYEVPRIFGDVRDTLGQTGTFGDTFGAVNSLFSALGVAGVAYALILQTRELEAARLEAEKTRLNDRNLAMLNTLVSVQSELTRWQENSLDKLILELSTEIATPEVVQTRKELARKITDQLLEGRKLMIRYNTYARVLFTEERVRLDAEIEKTKEQFERKDGEDALIGAEGEVPG